ncbi:hypothetical protein [Pseudomonas sp. S1(2024)]|uniref:hypothetical protein n=1 Tax=Pseudomonas sp. S1(2024) TaxID=3390191 RepID=UPI00397D144B
MSAEEHKAGCASIEQHIKTKGFDALPSPFAADCCVEIYRNGMPLGIDAPGDAVPFLVTLCSGAQLGTASKVLKQHPFDLGDYFRRQTYADDFNLYTANGENWGQKELFSRIIQAFALADPEHLRQRASGFQKIDGYAVFAAMEAGLPEIELGALIEAERARYRDGNHLETSQFALEHALSESPYLLTHRSLLPDGNPVAFLRKSGALHDDYLNGLHTRPYFWEGVMWGAFSAQGERQPLCTQLLNAALVDIEQADPGFALRLMRSIDFSRLEEAALSKSFVRGIFSLGKHAQSSMLLKIGVLQAATHQSDEGPIHPTRVLAPTLLGCAEGHMDVFVETPHLVVHDLLTELADMPAHHIGLNAFNSLSLVSKLKLPEQVWDIHTVTSAMTKLLGALTNFHCESAAPTTTKASIDESAIAALRQFNNTFLKRWGLNASVFTIIPEQAQAVLALSDFDLSALGQLSESTLRKRLELDLSL